MAQTMKPLSENVQDPAAPAVPPHLRQRADMPRYDLVALAAEAATDRSFDESAKIRVTQQDIRRLLERRRKERS